MHTSAPKHQSICCWESVLYSLKVDYDPLHLHFLPIPLIHKEDVFFFLSMQIEDDFTNTGEIILSSANFNTEAPREWISFWSEFKFRNTFFCPQGGNLSGMQSGIIKNCTAVQHWTNEMTWHENLKADYDNIKSSSAKIKTDRTNSKAPHTARHWNHTL